MTNLATISTACVSGLGPPEVNDDLLGFVDIQGQVVGFTPVHQILDLLSVGQVIIVLNKAHYCHVVHKPHNVVSSGPGTAVMSHHGEQQRTQDAAQPTQTGVCWWGNQAPSNRWGC